MNAIKSKLTVFMNALKQRSRSLIFLSFGICAAFLGVASFTRFPLSMVDVGLCLLIVLVPIQQYSLLYLSGRSGRFVSSLALIFLCWVSSFQILLPVVLTETFCLHLFHDVNRLNGKSTLRSIFLGTAAVGLVGSVVAFMMAFRVIMCSSTDYSLMISFFCMAVVYFIFAMVSAWGLAHLGASSNPWFFSRVLSAQSLSDPAPLVDQLNPEIYVLAALLRPSRSISRIREHVVPSVGSFSVTSEIEFEIPESLFRWSSLYFPVVLQGKCELTRELKVSAVSGQTPRRLNDDELIELLCNAFKEVFRICNWSQIDNTELKTLVIESLRYIQDEQDEDFDCRCRTLLSLAGICNRKQAELLTLFFKSVRYIKPICYKVDMTRNS